MRKTDTTRKCPKCRGLILPGEARCQCHTVEPVYHVAEGSVEAAHFYQLHKTIKRGSWAKTGYRRARSAYRSTVTQLYHDLGGAGGENRGWSIRRIPVAFSFSECDVAWLIFRCQLAFDKWRDEFAGLVQLRLQLLMGGCNQQKTRDHLGISRESLLYLDEQIQNCPVEVDGIQRCISLPDRVKRAIPGFEKFRRKMRAGAADRILRQRKMGYKQTQSLFPLSDTARTETLVAIYEGESASEHERNNTDEAASCNATC